MFDVYDEPSGVDMLFKTLRVTDHMIRPLLLRLSFWEMRTRGAVLGSSIHIPVVGIAVAPYIEASISCKVRSTE